MAGRAGSGKTTAAGMLAAILADRGYTSRLTGFAAALKQLCRDSGWNGRKDPAGRTLLQAVGQAARAIDPDHWITALAESITDDEPWAPDVVIIQDVRYPNEAAWIRRRGGTLVHLEGRGGLVGEAAGHESEAGVEILSQDWTAANTGNLEQLRIMITALADYLIPDEAAQ